MSEFGSGHQFPPELDTGIPVQFCSSEADFTGVFSTLSALVPPGVTWVLLGVDIGIMRAAAPPITAFGWFLDHLGAVAFTASADLPTGRDTATLSWRGRLPYVDGEQIIVSVDTPSIAHVSLSAWGVVMPYL